MGDREGYFNGFLSGVTPGAMLSDAGFNDAELFDGATEGGNRRRATITPLSE